MSFTYSLYSAGHKYDCSFQAGTILEESVVRLEYLSVVPEVDYPDELQNKFHHFAHYVAEVNVHVPARRQAVAKCVDWTGTQLLPCNFAFVEGMTEHQVEILCRYEQYYLQDPWIDLTWTQRAEKNCLVQELRNTVLHRAIGIRFVPNTTNESLDCTRLPHFTYDGFNGNYSANDEFQHFLAEENGR
ncbi:LOW QUALITY PROTEIN: hypothetical protein T265_13496 [Opisthorchis viverrini]|uniref:Uncharacterized protein n=1 Tax=Opisthorchis viverrini TaxID=6198 RepID=A0A074ZP54_OPIVI|nr:LOW QUALITY PROTEIN: hypothetical protein T265_13496 [Opisthorchis viverrini]KER28906.1 LOW QUALITY PROTEIN: hypothetical protein T265_13496 [Opisthorchis viverrini]